VPPPRIGLARGRSNFQLSSRAIVALCIALIVLVVLFYLLRSGAPLPPQTPAK
jgi:cell division protein FtsN